MVNGQWFEFGFAKLGRKPTGSPEPEGFPATDY